MKLNIIITGVTGMVGEGVLHETLLDSRVESILVISRKTCGITHPKLKEIIHSNFMDITTIENRLFPFDACFFCLGVSSIGKNEEEYSKLTYNLTTNFAQTLAKVNPQMTFCYVSGAGTDSSEKGKSMWARVKGKTENYIFSLPFKQVFAFRPAYIKPTKGLKNTLKFYIGSSFIYPILKLIIPNYVSTLKDIGIAMINCSIYGFDKSILDVKDINQVAKI
ncbi:MAG: NAD-dependent epimerase/dehydratase family protein [Bacteroidetes bacterium]|nr:NAD-dependent epimerase/dehydratase family protein [Bacteroidota bacterium]